MKALTTRLLAVALALCTSIAGAQQVLVPTRPVGDSSNAAASTAFVAGGGLASPTYTQVGVYDGANTNSLLYRARGSVASPVTDTSAVAVFQIVGNNTGRGATALYASSNKQVTGANQGTRAGWVECADAVGGNSSYCEAIRTSSFCNAGTGALCSGGTSLAVGANGASPNYLHGWEFQVFNNTGTNQTATFSSSKFFDGALLDCSGTNTCDAAVLVNPFNPVAFVTGFMAPSGTLSDSVVRSDGTTVHGVQFNNATCSSDCWLGPSGTSKIDGSGNGTFANLVGTTTNNNAPAGDIGEFVNSSVATPGSNLTTNVVANLTSVSLTAGDWDVWCNTYFLQGATAPAVTQVQSSLSLTTATLDTTNGRYNNTPGFGTTGFANPLSALAGPARFSLASTTTVFCAVAGTFSGASATLSSYGILQARRRR